MTLATGDPVRRSLLRAAMSAVGLAVLALPRLAWAQKPASPAEPAADAAPDNPMQVIEGVAGIEWYWTPRETMATLVNKGGPQPTVVWVGRVVDVRMGRSIRGESESVLEFLAAYMPLAKPGPFALAPPVRLRPETGDHFVVSLRSPPLNDELLKNLRQSLLDRTHYTVVVGEPRFIAPFGRHAAIFMQTRRASVAQQMKVDVVRD